jgi:hypothetical protein
VDPEKTWAELAECMTSTLEADWDRIDELADALLQWLKRPVATAADCLMKSRRENVLMVNQGLSIAFAAQRSSFRLFRK